METLQDVLEYKQKTGKSPNLDSVYSVLKFVEEYLVYLYRNGGKINIPVSFEYSEESFLRDSFRVSSSGKCARAIVYSVLYPEEKLVPSARSISIFQLGHFLHDLERYLISQVNELVDQEKEVRIPLREGSEYYLKGHIDGILKLKDKDVLIDVKTVNERAWKEFKKAPDEGYIAQLNLYMYAIGIKEAYLWVYNKSTSDRMIIPIPYKEELVEKLIEKFNSILDHIEQKELPERPYKPYVSNGVEKLPWQCSYCQYVNKCWPDFKKVVKEGRVYYIRYFNNGFYFDIEEEVQDVQGEGQEVNNGQDIWFV